MFEDILLMRCQLFLTIEQASANKARQNYDLKDFGHRNLVLPNNSKETCYILEILLSSMHGTNNRHCILKSTFS